MTTVSPLRSGAAVGALAAFTQYLRELQAKALATAVGDIPATEAPSLAVAPSTQTSVQVSADAVATAPALPSWQGPGTSTEVYVFFLYEEAFRRYQWGLGSALAMVGFGIIGIVTILQWSLQKRWVHYG